MRAPVSIIVPTLNAQAALPALLEALYEAVQAGLVRELIVVDGGSVDATCQIARDAGAEVLETPPSRGGQLRAGAAAAQGEWLLFLHADSVPEPGWTDAARAHMRSNRAGWFRLRFDTGGRAAAWVAGWANLRSRLFGLPYGDQGLILPRALYDSVGGFADIPLMEDVRIARALRGRMQPVGAVIRTSAARYVRDGWVRRGARNLWTLARYAVGVPPERLAASYDQSR